MNFKNACLCFLLCFSLDTYSQRILHLTDGSIIEFKKLKEKNGKLFLTDTEEREIKVDDVVGYFDQAWKDFYYKVPCLECKKNQSAFLRRVMAGRIEMFERWDYEVDYYGLSLNNPAFPATRFQNPQVTSVVFFYLKKDTLFDKVDSKVIPRYFDDSSEFHEKVSDKKFKTGDLKSVVREYNVKHFDKNPLPEYSFPGTVTFFIRSEKKIQGTIQVNDGPVIELSTRKTASINLDYKEPSKVCIEIGDNKTCELLVASQFAVMYYRIMSRKNGIMLDKVTDDEAQKNIAYNLQKK